MKKIFTLVTLMLTSLPSWSFTPESGLYWNESEPGSGYNFEIQDNFFFGVFYVYDDYGFPYWYTASGFLNGNSYFEGALFISEDGPCIACNWQQNFSYNSGLGNVRIDFLTETTATMRLLGETIFLERFNFFLGDELDKMRGEWQVVYDVSQYSNNFPFYADVLIFEQTEVFNGNDLATGCRSESTVFNNCTNYALNNNDLAAAYDYENDELIAVVRDDASHYLAYYLKTGTNQFDGEAYSYHVNSSPNLNLAGFPVRGFRTASKHFVDTGVGPSKSAVSNDTKATVGLNQMLDANKLANSTPSKMDEAQQARILRTIERLQQQLK
jgi:hypothetical protein